MLPPIYTTLRASSDVVAIVGNRIYRHGSAPQDVVSAVPKVAYVTWFGMIDPENNLSGLPPMDRVVVQVDCWHPTDAGVVTLATEVRDAIEPHAHMTGGPNDSKEPETGLYRMTLQFDWLLSR
jgi:hypothetical protein